LTTDDPLVDCPTFKRTRWPASARGFELNPGRVGRPRGGRVAEVGHRFW